MEQAVRARRVEAAKRLDPEYAAILSEIDMLDEHYRDYDKKIEDRVKSGKSYEDLTAAVEELIAKRAFVDDELAQREPEARARLAARVVTSQLSPAEAADEALSLGIDLPATGWIDYPTVSAVSDPSAANWSLTMAVAWIIWRNGEDVTWQWTEALKGVRRWKREGDGHGPALLPMPSINLLQNRPTTPDGAMIYAANFSQTMSVEKAVQLLRSALASSELIADSDRGPILPSRWSVMSICSGDAGDELRNAAADLVFRDITVRRDDVIGLWPARSLGGGSAPKPAAPADVGTNGVEEPEALVGEDQALVAGDAKGPTEAPSSHLTSVEVSPKPGRGRPPGSGGTNDEKALAAVREIMTLGFAKGAATTTIGEKIATPTSSAASSAKRLLDKLAKNKSR